jgi:hypothetical protein
MNFSDTLLTKEYAAHIAHEYCHMLGFADRGSRAPKYRDVVPYAVGDLALKLLKENKFTYEKQPEPVLPKTVSDKVSFIQPVAGPYVFDTVTMEFPGSKAEQTSHLLRQVKHNGIVASAPAQLPDALMRILSGQTPVVSLDQVEAYLSSHGLSNESVGGNIHEKLSVSKQGIMARYFVIHDTSSPELTEDAFPADMNDFSWSGNNLTAIPSARSKKAHVYVNRVGNSITQVSFNEPWRATKFELSKYPRQSKGVFLHVEMIQPRRFSNSGSSYADIAPDPGFTDAQVKRLALLYIIASARKGEWLTPVFHAVLDDGLKGGHDDPQHFDLGKWSAKIEELLGEMVNSKSSLTSVDCSNTITTIHLKGAGWSNTLTLPTSGRFTMESHYVTNKDVIQGGGFPHQDKQDIDQHLERALKLYQQYDSTMTLKQLFNTKWHVVWTPAESGNVGQAAVGARQLQLLTPEEEMWLITMNWATNADKPAIGTKFLLSYQGRFVVVVAGYEKGPAEQRFIGGVTPEVHRWLKSDSESTITVSLLKDQSVAVGPCLCK